MNSILTGFWRNPPTTRIALFFEKSRRDECRQMLEDLGCSCEGSHLKYLISVNVPPTAKRDAITKYLDEGEAREAWTYEQSAVR